jgi:putative methyltransferase (TIGR04325 family)
MKDFIKLLIPPLVLKLWHWMKGIKPGPVYGFVGSYPSFAAAEAEASGYQTEGYSIPVANYLRAMVSEPPLVAIDERFMQVHSALSYIVQSENAASLKVLDYGGGSGGYAKAIRQLMPATAIDWTILESPIVVGACEKVVGSPARYAFSVNSQSFDVAIISGTLQYLEEPWPALEDTARHVRWVILTRLPVVSDDSDQVTLQRVPPHQNGGSMAVWLLSEKKLREWIGDRLVLEWVVTGDAGMAGMVGAVPRGFLIQIRKP